MSQSRCKQATDQHNSFGNYYFLYKNSINQWHIAMNPVFIAIHQHCRAIPREVVLSIGYTMISDLVYNLNNDKLTSKELSILAEFDIHK